VVFVGSGKITIRKEKTRKSGGGGRLRPLNHGGHSAQKFSKTEAIRDFSTPLRNLEKKRLER